MEVLFFWLVERTVDTITWMINRYMNTIGNKKLELFDMGAGASESTAEGNVQLASGNMFGPPNIHIGAC